METKIEKTKDRKKFQTNSLKVTESELTLLKATLKEMQEQFERTTKKAITPI